MEKGGDLLDSGFALSIEGGLRSFLDLQDLRDSLKMQQHILSDFSNKASNHRVFHNMMLSVEKSINALLDFLIEGRKCLSDTTEEEETAKKLDKELDLYKTKIQGDNHGLKRLRAMLLIKLKRILESSWRESERRGRGTSKKNDLERTSLIEFTRASKDPVVANIYTDLERIQSKIKENRSKLRQLELILPKSPLRDSFNSSLETKTNSTTIAEPSTCATQNETSIECFEADVSSSLMNCYTEDNIVKSFIADNSERSPKFLAAPPSKCKWSKNTPTSTPHKSALRAPEKLAPTELFPLCAEENHSGISPQDKSSNHFVSPSNKKNGKKILLPIVNELT
eukprot:jgi/Bigna1/76857/fgenesh1_pg.44_\